MKSFLFLALAAALLLSAPTRHAQAAEQRTGTYLQCVSGCHNSQECSNCCSNTFAELLAQLRDCQAEYENCISLPSSPRSPTAVCRITLQRCKYRVNSRTRTFSCPGWTQPTTSGSLPMPAN
ncbi:MAG: hypothetical protein H0S85_15920 [Desulfovibrionaceae bacterium]|jgi:hypothetical protein|nr:hypothetical protein [Desulfovibrionaceae bacterium]